jgi:GNAT superfamily N-acetyltransferase
MTDNDGGTVRIRRATVEDAAAMAALSAVLGYPVEADEFAARLARCVDARDDAVFVAADDGDVYGWIHGADHRLLDSGRQCEILTLIVDSRHRRSGIGQRLVGEIAGWASARGVPRLTVRSNVLRAESHPFYERVGFTRIKTQHVYRRDL